LTLAWAQGVPPPDDWPIVWQPWKKHIPPREATSRWDEFIERTARKGSPSYYHPELGSKIRELETDCLMTGTPLEPSIPTKRYYWKRFDREVGASDGESTHFILVEHLISGEFHGHPRTWRELKRKGAIDETHRP